MTGCVSILLTPSSLFWVTECSGLHCVPPHPSPHSQGEAPVPSISAWDHVWRQGLCRGNQAKVRSLRHDCCLFQKGNSGREPCTRQDDVETQGEASRLQTKDRKEPERESPSQLTLTHCDLELTASRTTGQETSFILSSQSVGL